MVLDGKLVPPMCVLPLVVEFERELSDQRKIDSKNRQKSEHLLSGAHIDYGPHAALPTSTHSAAARGVGLAGQGITVPPRNLVAQVVTPNLLVADRSRDDDTETRQVVN